MLSELQEGFFELFSVKSHRLPVLGCQSIRVGQEIKLFNNVIKTDVYLSWDPKHLFIWEKGQKSRDIPSITHSLKFPKINLIMFILQLIHLHVKFSSSRQMIYLSKYMTTA